MNKDLRLAKLLDLYGQSLLAHKEAEKKTKEVIAFQDQNMDVYDEFFDIVSVIWHYKNLDSEDEKIEKVFENAKALRELSQIGS